MTMYPVSPISQPVVVKALSSALGNIRVSTKIPQPRPREHVVVSRIGSQSPEFGVSSPRYLIEVYSDNELNTERLAEKVHSTWLNLTSKEINRTYSDWNLQPYESPDTDHTRYQFTGGLQLLL